MKCPCSACSLYRAWECAIHVEFTNRASFDADRPTQLVDWCLTYSLSDNRENTVGLDPGQSPKCTTGNPILRIKSYYTCPGSTTEAVPRNPVMLDNVDGSTLVLTTVADDDRLLLNTCVDGVEVAVLVIIEVVHDIDTTVVTALVTDDDELLPGAVADTDVEVLVFAVLIGGAVPTTVECSTVLVFNALVLLDVVGDDLLDSARLQTRVNTGDDDARKPVVIDNVDANTLVLTAVADDDVLPLHGCEDGVKVTVLVILEVVDDINTSVDDAHIVQDDGLLLETVADADVQVLASPGLFRSAVSTTVKCSAVSVLTAIVLLDVNGDKTLNSTRAETLVDIGGDVTLNPVASDDVDTSKLVLTDIADDDAAHADVKVLVLSAVIVGAVPCTVQEPGVLVFTALAVFDVDGDEMLDSAREKVMVGNGVDIASVGLDDVDTRTLVLTAIADDDVLPLNNFVNGVGTLILVILEVVDDVNTPVVNAIVLEDDRLLLKAAADADVEVLVSPAVQVDVVSATVESSGVLVFTANAVLDVDGDYLSDSARVEVMGHTGGHIAMKSVLLDNVEANTLVLTAIADDVCARTSCLSHP